MDDLPEIPWESDQLREIGLGYNFSALKDDIEALIFDTIKTVLPVNEEEDTDCLRLSRSRLSIKTIAVVKLEDALRRLDTEKCRATETEQKARTLHLEAEKLTAKMELYLHTADAIKKALTSVPPPKPPQQTVTASRTSSLAPKNGPIAANPRTTNTWSKNLQSTVKSSLPPAARKATAKPKGPPPKPEPKYITEEEFLSMSTSLREKVKLSDLNHAYKILYEAFYDELLEQIKMSDVARRGIKVSTRTERNKFLILRQLKRINLSSDNSVITPTPEFA